jgi:hypothetical protein
MATVPNKRIYVTTLGRIKESIDKTESAIMMDARIKSAKALQRMFPTTVSSYLQFRDWIRSVTFDVRQCAGYGSGLPLGRYRARPGWRRCLEGLRSAAVPCQGFLPIPVGVNHHHRHNRPRISMRTSSSAGHKKAVTGSRQML